MNRASLRCCSEAALTRYGLLALGLLACGFGYGQNHLGVTGGPIALPKLLWLATTLWAWLLQPLVLYREATLSAIERRCVLGLLGWMAIRAGIEGVMLYWTHSWDPAYGLAFNAVAIVGLLWGATRNQGWFRAHLVVLALMFAVESGFALYMRLFFVTHGHTPTYFVPDEPRYQWILAATWAAVLAAWGWQWIFLRWRLWRN